MDSGPHHAVLHLLSRIALTSTGFKGLTYLLIYLFLIVIVILILSFHSWSQCMRKSESGPSMNRANCDARC